MIIPKITKCIVLILISVCILFNFSSAQHFIRMTDEQWIQLSLDMIRKGIQQQDTTKLFMVSAPQVKVKGKSTEVKGSLTSTLQAIFDNSSKRELLIEKPAFPREDNPLHSSNFWDFDILDPVIKILGDPVGGGKGDLAIVDCELVLWGAPPVKGSDQTVGDPARGGSGRIKERFIFKSPPKIEQTPPSGDGGRWPIDLSGKHTLARPTSGKKWTSSIKSWQLTGFENLLDFLNGEIEGSHKQNKQKVGR
jgi:hypothetical protein